MISILKMVRLPNLLIMALTMYFVRWFLLIEFIALPSGVSKQPMPGLMNTWVFAALVISVVLIGAAGYIINDYFDTRIDRINKPERVIIDKEISRSRAIFYHILLSSVAVLLGMWVAWRIGNIQFAAVHFISVGLLWFYSTTFKKSFLTGNIIISLLTAMVPFTVGLFELQVLRGAPEVMIFIGGYAVFAFIVSLAREIIKDIEDYEGDHEMGCRTLPIVLGKTVARAFAIALLLGTMAALGYIQFQQHVSGDTISWWYFMIALQLPIAFTIYLSWVANTKKQLHLAGLFAKGVLLAGVCSMVVFYLS